MIWIAATVFCVGVVIAFTSAAVHVLRQPDPKPAVRVLSSLEARTHELHEETVTLHREHTARLQSHMATVEALLVRQVAALEKMAEVKHG